MANAITYIANLGKSVTYSTIDKIVNNNESLGEFVDANRDLGSIFYKSIKDIKGTYTKGIDLVKKSAFGEAASEYKTAFLEDIKTGNFYNRERISKMTMRAAGDLGNFDDFGDPFSEIDGELDDFNLDDSDIGDDDLFMADTLNSVGEETSNAINRGTIGAAEYMVESNKRYAINSMKHQEHLFGGINIGIGAVNANISSLVKFNESIVRTHVENSTTFFDTSTKLDTERNTILKQILENQEKILNSKDQQKKDTSYDLSYEDITMSGVPDLLKYGKKILNNVKEATGGVSDLNGIFEGGNLMLSLAGAPLKVVTDFIANKLIPDSFDRLMKSANKSIEGIFGSAIMKFNSLAKNDDPDANPILRMIGKTFGMDMSARSTINTSKYYKGPLQWDGESKKALVDVIPAQLSRIISLMSNTPEDVFDFDKGKFTNLEEYRASRKKSQKSEKLSAADEIMEQMNSMMKGFTGSRYQIESLKKDIENMFITSFNQGKLVDYRKKGDASSVAYDLGIEDADNLDIIKAMIDSLPKNYMLNYNNKLAQSIQRNNESKKALEKKGSGIETLFYNGYIKDKDYDSRDKRKPFGYNILANAKDNLGRDIFYYMQNMYKELKWQRDNWAYTSGLAAAPSGGTPTTPPSPTAPHLSSIDSISIERSSAAQRYESVDIYDDENHDRMQERNIENARANEYHMLSMDEINSIEDPKEKQKQIRIMLERNKKSFDHKVNMDDEIKRSQSLSIFRKLAQSGKVSDKSQDILLGLDELSHKPVTFLANILQKADDRLYELIYGSETEKKTDPKSFLGNLMLNMRLTFSTFNSWLTETFVDPLASRFLPLVDRILDKLNLGDGKLGMKIKNAVAGYTDEDGEVHNGMFGGMRNGVVNSFKRAYGPVIDYLHGNRLDSTTNIDEFIETIPEDLREPARQIIRGKRRKQVFQEMMDETSERARNDTTYNTLVKDSDGNPIVGSDGKPITHRSEANSIHKKVQEKLKNLKAQGVEWAKPDEDRDKNEIAGYAVGTPYVTKTGIAALSEGEMVIPAELNPFNNKEKETVSKMQQIYKENSKIKEFKDIIKKYFGDKDLNDLDINGFAEGNENVTVDTDGKVKKGKGNFFKRASGYITRREERKSADDEDGEPHNKYSKYDYVEGQEPYVVKVANELSSGIKSLFATLSSAASDTKEKISNKFNDVQTNAIKSDNRLFGAVVDDVTHRAFSDYIPAGIGGAIAGAGVSVITGAVGGPLLGAAVGAGLNIINESNSIKDLLFGEKDYTGKRTGNIISKELSQNIQKYFPDMATGAVVGGITSILPFVPGGPVTGIILGSSIGFAKNNQKIMDSLFGKQDEDGNRDDSGFLNPQSLEKLKKALPRMGAGAVAGLIAGPFGIVGNMMLGSAIGYATTTNRFKEAIFGKENENGEKEGGLLQTLKTGVIDPLSEFTTDGIKTFKDWFKRDIVDNITNSIKPIGKQITLGIASILGVANEKIDDFFDKRLGVPIEKFLREKIIIPLGKTTKVAIEAIAKPVGKVISSPARLIGSVGNHFKRTQVANGNADYMTAQERLDYRASEEEKGKSRFFGRTLGRNKVRKDKFKEFDSLLANLDKSSLEDMSKSFDYLHSPEKTTKKEKNDAINKLNKGISYDYNLDYDQANKIIKYIDKGNIGKARSYIDELSFGGDIDKRDKLLKFITDETSKMEASDMVMSNQSGYKARMSDRLNKLGLKDINLNDKKSVEKYRSLIKTEIKSKTDFELKEDADQKRHVEVVDLLKEAVSNLKMINDPEYKKSVLRLRHKANMETVNNRSSWTRMLDRGSRGLYDDLTPEEIEQYKRDGLWDDIEEFRTNNPEDDELFEHRAAQSLRGSFIGRKASRLKRRLTGKHLFGKLEDDEYDIAAKKNRNLRSISNSYYDSLYRSNQNGQSIPLEDVPEELRGINGSFDVDDGELKKAQKRVRRKDKFDSVVKRFSRKDSIKSDDQEEDQNENDTINANGEDDGKKSSKSKFKWFSTLYGRKRYKTDAKGGEYQEDTSDTETKETINKEKEQQGIFSKLLSKTTDMGKDIKDGFFRFFGIKQEEDSWRKKLGKIAIGTAGVLTALGGTSRLSKWWTKTAFPVIKDLFAPIAPLISQTATSLATGIDNIVLSVPSKIDQLINTIKVVATRDIPNFFINKVFPLWKEGIEFAGDTIIPKIGYFIGRYAPAFIENLAKGIWGYLKLNVSDIFGGSMRQGKIGNSADSYRKTEGLYGLGGTKAGSAINTNATDTTGPFYKLLQKMGVADAKTASTSSLDEYGNPINTAKNKISSISSGLQNGVNNIMNNYSTYQNQGDMSAIVGGYGTGATEALSKTNILDQTNNSALVSQAKETASNLKASRNSYNNDAWEGTDTNPTYNANSIFTDSTQAGQDYYSKLDAMVNGTPNAQNSQFNGNQSASYTDSTNTAYDYRNFVQNGGIPAQYGADGNSSENIAVKAYNATVGKASQYFSKMVAENSLAVEQGSMLVDHYYTPDKKGYLSYKNRYILNTEGKKVLASGVIVDPNTGKLCDNKGYLLVDESGSEIDKSRLVVAKDGSLGIAILKKSSDQLKSSQFYTLNTYTQQKQFYTEEDALILAANANMIDRDSGWVLDQYGMPIHGLYYDPEKDQIVTKVTKGVKNAYGESGYKGLSPYQNFSSSKDKRGNILTKDSIISGVAKTSLKNFASGGAYFSKRAGRIMGTTLFENTRQSKGLFGLFRNTKKDVNNLLSKGVVKAGKLGSSILPESILPKAAKYAKVGGPESYAAKLANEAAENSYNKTVDKYTNWVSKKYIGKEVADLTKEESAQVAKRTSELLQSSTVYKKNMTNAASEAIQKEFKTQIPKDMADDLASSAVKNNQFIDGAMKNGTRAIGGYADDAVEAVSRNAGKSKSIMTGIVKVVEAVLNLMKKIPVVGPLVKKVDLFKNVKKLGGAISDVIAKAATKILGPQKLAKLTSNLARFTGIGTIILTAADFVSGYRNAATTMQLTEDQVTIVDKCIMGTLNLIINLPFFFPVNIIPLSTFYSLWLNIAPAVFPSLNDWATEQKEKQTATNKTLSEYNANNNTSLTLQEFNNKDKLLSKAWVGVKDGTKSLVHSVFGHNVSEKEYNKKLDEYTDQSESALTIRNMSDSELNALSEEEQSGLINSWNFDHGTALSSFEDVIDAFNSSEENAKSKADNYKKNNTNDGLVGKAKKLITGKYQVGKHVKSALNSAAKTSNKFFKSARTGLGKTIKGAAKTSNKLFKGARAGLGKAIDGTGKLFTKASDGIYNTGKSAISGIKNIISPSNRDNTQSARLLRTFGQEEIKYMSQDRKLELFNLWNEEHDEKVDTFDDMIAAFQKEELETNPIKNFANSIKKSIGSSSIFKLSTDIFKKKETSVNPITKRLGGKSIDSDDQTISSQTLSGLTDKDIQSMDENTKVQLISQWNADHESSYTTFDEVVAAFQKSQSDNGNLREKKKLSTKNILSSLTGGIESLALKAKKNIDKSLKNSDSALSKFNRFLGRSLGFHDDNGDPLSITEMAKSTLDSKNPSEAMFYVEQIASTAGGVFGVIYNHASKWLAKAYTGVKSFFKNHNPISFIKEKLGITKNKETEPQEITSDDIDAVASGDLYKNFSTSDSKITQLTSSKLYKSKSPKYVSSYAPNNSGFYKEKIPSASGSGLVNNYKNLSAGSSHMNTRSMGKNPIRRLYHNAPIPKMGKFSAAGSGDYLGKYVKNYESGSSGSLTIAPSGSDGGLSFGTFQLTWKYGTALKFWNKYYGSKYGTVSGNGSAYTLKPLWEKAASADRNGFLTNEQQFVYDTYFVPVCNNLRGYFDPNKHSRGMQECLWSWSVHRSPNVAAKEFRQAMSSAGIMSPQTAAYETIVNACYNYRLSILMTKSPSTRKGFTNRYGTVSGSERNKILGLKGKPPISQSGNALSSSISMSSSNSSSNGGNWITNLTSKITKAGLAFMGIYDDNGSSSDDSTAEATTDSSEATVDDLGAIDTSDSTAISDTDSSTSTSTKSKKKKSSKKAVNEHNGSNKAYPTGSNTNGKRPSSVKVAGPLSAIDSAKLYSLKMAYFKADTARENYFRQHMQIVQTSAEKKEHSRLSKVAANKLDLLYAFCEKKKIDQAPIIKEATAYKNSHLAKKETLLSSIANKFKKKKSAGSSGFVSQLDPQYANERFGDSTIGEEGCGPAVATMALSSLGVDASMNDAKSLAERYKDEGGTKASYFKDIFGRYGANVAYHGEDNKGSIINDLKSGKQVVMMGQDEINQSKSTSPFGPNPHYVLASGLDDNGNIIVKDPELSQTTIYDKGILDSTKLGVSISGAGSSIAKRTPSWMGDDRDYGIESRSNKNEQNSPNTTLTSSLLNKGSVSSKKKTKSKPKKTTTKSTSKKQSITPNQKTDNTNFGQVMNELADKYVDLAYYWNGLQPPSNTASVSTNDISSSNGSDGEKVVAVARSFIGKVRYSMGASNPEGGVCDCSGFTQYCFKKIGIDIGRDTLAQVKKGVKISKDQLQVGDIVFFQGTYRAGVSHVGIYSGNGNFIHCGSSKGVGENSLNESYYVKHWLEARRVINSASGSGLPKSSSLTSANKQLSTKHKNESAGASHVAFSNVTSSKVYPISKESTSISKKTVESQSKNTGSDGVTDLLVNVVKLLTNIADSSEKNIQIVKLLTKIVSNTSRSGKGSGIKSNSSNDMTSILTQNTGNSSSDIARLFEQLDAIIAD